ncbi:hypothetical protein IscW_ISCW000744, partial [Ixodes scapularis]
TKKSPQQQNKFFYQLMQVQRQQQQAQQKQDLQKIQHISQPAAATNTGVAAQYLLRKRPELPFLSIARRGQQTKHNSC